jgi:hypothetical protein
MTARPVCCAMARSWQRHRRSALPGRRETHAFPPRQSSTVSERPALGSSSSGFSKPIFPLPPGLRAVRQSRPTLDQGKAVYGPGNPGGADRLYSGRCFPVFYANQYRPRDWPISPGQERTAHAERKTTLGNSSISSTEPRRSPPLRAGRRYCLSLAGDSCMVAGTAGELSGAWRNRHLTDTLGTNGPCGTLPVFRAWMGAAKVLSKITTPIPLAVVYFLVLTPIALLRRLAGKGRISSPGGEGF